MLDADGKLHSGGIDMAESLPVYITIIYLDDNNKLKKLCVDSGEAPFKIKDILNNNHYRNNRDEHPLIFEGSLNQMNLFVEREITKVTIQYA